MPRSGFPLPVALHLAGLGIANGLRRCAYLVVTLAVTAASWLLLATMASPFLFDPSPSDNGIVVRNARSPQQPLPMRYASRIEALSDTGDVVYMALKFVSCPDASMITLNAIGGSGTMRELRKSGFPLEAIERWQNDPLGVLLDEETATRCQWKVGTGISPLDEISRQPLPLHITATAANTDSTDAAATAHYEYINRNSSMAGADRVNKIYVQAAHRDRQEALAAQIESEFAHDDPPVSAYPDTESDNVRDRFSNVQYLLGVVMCALLLCCILVLVSVLAHATTERRSQLALLLVLGFPRSILLAGFAIECLILLLTGMLLGALLGLTAIGSLPDSLHVIFVASRPPTWVWWLMPVLLCAVSMVALLFPTAIIARIRPVDCRP